MVLGRVRKFRAETRQPKTQRRDTIVYKVRTFFAFSSMFKYAIDSRNEYQSKDILADSNRGFPNEKKRCFQSSRVSGFEIRYKNGHCVLFNLFNTSTRYECWLFLKLKKSPERTKMCLLTWFTATHSYNTECYFQQTRSKKVCWDDIIISGNPYGVILM